jgi:thiol-disulfide isomerase/thioredoxin
VPSCVLVGRKLDNFALYDLDRQPWEYRRDHLGRLTLLDFWHSTCPPCLQAIPHMVDLKRRYGPTGLEVIGIACEKGTPEQQSQKVRQVRARYTINYTTLLSGGGTEACPVKKQFGVTCFPTLILLDETGQIVWRREGADEQILWELEVEIQRRLGLRGR